MEIIQQRITTIYKGVSLCGELYLINKNTMRVVSTAPVRGLACEKHFDLFQYKDVFVEALKPKAVEMLEELYDDYVTVAINRAEYRDALMFLNLYDEQMHKEMAEIEKQLHSASSDIADVLVDTMIECDDFWNHDKIDRRHVIVLDDGTETWQKAEETVMYLNQSYAPLSVEVVKVKIVEEK